MGVPVLILGESGSGKSTALRNFEPDEIGIFNVAGKPLPFRKHLKRIDNATYDVIKSVLTKNDYKAYAIDDSQYLMAFDMFDRAKQKGYDKFTDIAVDFEQLLRAASATSPDTIVYFLHHTDLRDDGRIQPKTVGKMLTNQLTVEGLFPIVLMSDIKEGQYGFITNSDGTNPCKTPMGMFAESFAANDLKMVDNVIREYWELAPIKEPEGKAKK